MGTLLFLLLALSVPIFYVIGAIDFFKTILGKKANNPQNRKQFLKQVIKELSDFSNNHPKATIPEILTFFKGQLKQQEKQAEQQQPQEFFTSSEVKFEKAE